MAGISEFLVKKLLKKERIDNIKGHLDCAAISMDVYKFLFYNAVLALAISVASGIFVYAGHGIAYAFLAFFSTIFAYYFAVSSWVMLMESQRARYAEKILPDMLMMLASNLRSGITPEEAFTLSSRPEFGFLAVKIKKASKYVATGTSVQEAFSYIAKGINSRLFKQTIAMLIEGINSGAGLADLLENTASDIKDTAFIRKESRSTLLVYAIFIFMAASLIAPVLYSVSIQLASILSKLGHTVSVEYISKKAVGINLAPTNISGAFLVKFAYVNLIVTTGFGALIFALINKGDEKYGLKYIPFFVGIALAIFYVVNMVLKAFFGGIRIV